MSNYGLTVLLYAGTPNKLRGTIGSLLQQKASPKNHKRLQLLLLDATPHGEAEAVLQATLKEQDHRAVDAAVYPVPGLSAAESYAAAMAQVEGEAVCFASSRVFYTGDVLAGVTETVEQEPDVSAWKMSELQAEGTHLPLHCFEAVSAGKTGRSGLPERYVYRTETVRDYTKEQFKKMVAGSVPSAPRLSAACACVRVWDCFLTVVLYADEEERLEGALKEIVDQKDLFRYGRFCDNHAVQILVLDPHCSEITEQTCEKMKKQYRHIQRVPAEDLADYEAYNKILGKIRGYYVTFTAASARYNGNTFSMVEHVFTENSVAMVALRACYYLETGQLKNYAMMPRAGDRSIQLSANPFALHLHFNAYFMETALLSGCRFDESLGGESTVKLLLDLLQRAGSYYYLKQQQYIYSAPREDNTSTFMQQHEVNWYTDAVRRFLLPLLTSNEKDGLPAPEYLQAACMYLLYARYNCNLNERTKGALEGEALDEFFAVSGELLAHITDAVITQKKQLSVAYPRVLIFFWLRLRAVAMRCPLTVNTNGESFYYTFEERETMPSPDHLRRLSVCNAEQLIISTMNYHKGMLEIDAKLSLPDFYAEDQMKLSVKLNGRPVTVQPTHTYALISCFGRLISDRTVYHISVPLADVAQGDISFSLKLNGHSFPLRLIFQTAHSRLSNLPGSYWKYDVGRVMVTSGSSLRIRPLDRSAHRRMELHFLKESYQMGRQFRYVVKSVMVRTLYWVTRPFFRNKRIWITFDKLYKAGDNGEYIYRYIAKQKDDVKPYYIIKKDSLDYKRLKKDGVRLLKFYTLRCLLTCLNAEVVLTTHANVISYCGFLKKVYPYFRDLFSPEIICIQHGLTTQSIAQFQNRLFDNLKLYCCASPKEIENLTQPDYGFQPEQLKLTGLARYDGLINNDQKNILITPTWRRNIVNSNVAHMQKKHSEFFRNSEYFRLYDRLIHDEELIACAKECGYSITYLLHPGMSAQIDDFDNTGYVDVVAAYSDVNYEKILTEASLMVTDYSGVQFDFAYMRKPLVYYHPNTLPPHYEESDAFRCEVDGFGPIVDHHEQLIRELCEYMRNGCKMKEEYVARADRFFAFSDHDNCRRIYEAVREYMDNR